MLMQIFACVFCLQQLEELNHNVFRRFPFCESLVVDKIVAFNSKLIEIGGEIISSRHDFTSLLWDVPPSTHSLTSSGRSTKAQGGAAPPLARKRFGSGRDCPFYSA
ncbi:hypothetical protein ACE6H2_000703 [Prunus campanulata]